jgi:hypothetical protein
MPPTVIPSKYAMMPEEQGLYLGAVPTGASGDPSVARTVFPGTSPPPAAGVAPLTVPEVSPETLDAFLERLKLQQAGVARPSAPPPPAATPGPMGAPAPAVAPPAPGLFSPENLTALIERLKSGNAVERAVGAGGEVAGQQIGEGVGQVRAGLQGLRDQPTLPSPETPMGPTPNLGALGRTLWGGLQIAGGPVAGVGRALSELPITLGEAFSGRPRSPQVDQMRQTGETGLGLVLPFGLGVGKLGATRKAEEALQAAAPFGKELTEIGAGHYPPPPRVPKVAPFTGTMTPLYDAGQALQGGIWYHGMDRTIRRIAGSQPESYKLASVIASLSPQSPAGALTKSGMAKLHPPGGGPALGVQEAGDISRGSNLYVADRVWQAYQRGGIDEVARLSGPMTEQVPVLGRTGKPRMETVITVKPDGTEVKTLKPVMQTVPSDLAKQLAASGETHLGIGMTGDKRENVLRALKGEEIGGEDARKIQEFRSALLGDPNAIVLDSWMKRIFYPDDRSEVFSAAQYDATAQLIRDYAASVSIATGEKVTPRDVQAAMWVAKKFKEEGAAAAASGSMPFMESYRHVYIHHGRDLAAFGDPATQQAIMMHLALAGMVLASAKAARARSGLEAASGL